MTPAVKVRRFAPAVEGKTLQKHSEDGTGAGADREGLPLDEASFLVTVVRAVLARPGTAGWEVQQTENACFVAPAGQRRPEAGWQLSVLVSSLATPIALARAAQALVRRGCAFEFAAEVGRPVSGLFITVYPADHEQFRRVVEDLDRVTGGLPGPERGPGPRLATAAAVAPAAMPAEPFPLDGLVRVLLAAEPAGSWTAGADGPRYRVQPAGHRAGPNPQPAEQLHVSATPLSAPIILAQAARVLVRHGCAFSYADSLDAVEALVSTECEPGVEGRFITAYPEDGDQLRTVAEALDQALRDLPGPRISSARPLRPGSLVHFETGGSAGPRRAPEPPADVLLGNRFLVCETIQRTSKGAVYRAIDSDTGDEVVIKEARPHIGATLAGTDVRDALRQEAVTLELLESTGIAPHRIAVWEQDGSFFLAQELVPGQLLRDWAAGGTGLGGRPRAGWSSADAMRVARELFRLVEVAHAKGLVLRDLNPGSIMLTPGGELRLVDLKHAARAGGQVVRTVTPGYTAPELVSAPRLGPVPARSADLYSLGATLFYTLTGVRPPMPAEPPGRSVGGGNLRQVLESRAAEDPVLARWLPLLLALMAVDPARRWTLGQVRAFLDVWRVTARAS